MPSSSPRAPLIVVIGDDTDAVRRAALSLVRRCQDDRPEAVVVDAPPAERWPFLYPLVPALPPGPVIVLAEHVHGAVTSHQTNNTRLVTTQAGYLFAEWDAALASHGAARLVATARRDVVARHADEILRRRGVFRNAEMVEVEGPGDLTAHEATPSDVLAAAFRTPDPAERLRGCVDALAHVRTAARVVAAASACQEVNDLDAAARDLDEAIALAPDWAAPRFERGKVWLRRDDMDAAAASFRAAADRLPGFGGAWGNLGATLGELDRPAEALAAFERLLALDPESPQAVNNVGVVTRELGRLSESEAAFRRVVALEPDLAFGYYNLGHTLFLQGRYQAAAGAYAQGQTRDPQPNPVQATRLALCRLATGDADGALAELRRATSALSRDYRRQVMADTSAVLWALVTHKPDLTGWQPAHDWLRGELSRLA
ncbi:MAG TPA: tetratricopeptide repeat protein [Vicinamibacterales bacterium]|nr:tetratricopeptide repeat protein [Vicinamibacterales bacterium]